MIPGRQGKKELATECRHRVQVQRRALVSDGEGGHTETWSALGTYWGAVYPMSSKQAFEYNSINVNATHIIKIRGFISLLEKDRFYFDSRYFEILTIENIQERDIIKVCACLERRD